MAERLTATVIIPFYESQKFIAATLDSVRAQTRCPDEIIVIDDGSMSDAARAMITSLEGAEDLHVVRQSNHGIAHVLTRGAKIARSDVIFEVDADDVLDPRYIERYMEVFESDPAVGLVTSGYRTFFDGDDWCDPRSWYSVYRPLGYRSPEHFYHNCICASNTAFRARDVARVGYWWTRDEFPGPQDWGIGLKFAAAEISMHVIPEELYYYRTHAQGFSQRIERDYDIDAALARTMGEILHDDPGWITKEEYIQQKSVIDRERRMRPRRGDVPRVRWHHRVKMVRLMLMREGICRTLRRVWHFVTTGKGTL